ncbi:hypothetical protein DIPPA_33155 [Diplonema papillatum]|nr:hypothetical protein DIPPA_33155 [Diplonema papillatum]
MSDAQTAVEHGQSRSITEGFEARWKKFVKWMEAGGLRESALLEFVTTVAHGLASLATSDVCNPQSLHHGESASKVTPAGVT